MKKNKMMRLASALLVAVMLSTSVISGTYAKYVSTGFSDETARVAEWGVGFNKEDGLFLVKYNKDDNSVTEITGHTVDAETEKVVAPGTTNSNQILSLTGTPEVAVKVTHDAEITVANWFAAGAEYFPIVFTIDGETYGMPGTGAKYSTGFSTVDDLLTAVENAIEVVGVAYYEANTNLATVSATDYPNVTWTWAFEGNGLNGNTYQQDALDTILGDAAANGTPATVNVKITTTVTQVD